MSARVSAGVVDVPGVDARRRTRHRRLVGGDAGAVGCPGVRCVSIAVTGDVLLHPPLLEQARADDPTGGGMDFGPMLAAQAPYVAAADLGICHLETPLAPAEGPFSGYPEFSVPPQILPALTGGGV